MKNIFTILSLATVFCLSSLSLSAQSADGMTLEVTSKTVDKTVGETTVNFTLSNVDDIDESNNFIEKLETYSEITETTFDTNDSKGSFKVQKMREIGLVKYLEAAGITDVIVDGTSYTIGEYREAVIAKRK